MKKFILICICFSVWLSALPADAESKKVIGWLEMVRIYPGNLKMRAKMDTGAKSSSINVYKLQKFERAGETWINFEIREKTKNKKGKSATFEKKVIDSVKIKKKGGGLEERIVVKLEICLAGVHKEIEVGLLDRSNFHYQVLIGRTDLENIFVIDPAEVFTHKPDCKITVKMDQ